MHSSHFLAAAARPVLAVLSLVLVSCPVVASPVAASSRPLQVTADEPLRSVIVLDGDFDDWTTVPGVIDAGDDAAAASPVDLGRLQAIADDRFFHVLLDLGAVVNLQKLDGSLQVVLDADGTVDTGRPAHGMDGVDLVLTMTPPPSRPGRDGMGCSATLLPADAAVTPSADVTLSPYRVGLVIAPTHAASTVELRIDRALEFDGRAPLLVGDTARLRAAFVGPSGDVTDVTPTVEIAMPIIERPITERTEVEFADPGPDPLARSSAADLRIVSWNALRGRMLERPNHFVPTLRALEPDVVLLQELTEAQTAEAMETYFNSHVPLDGGERWTAIFGAGGGFLRCCVITHLPVVQAPGMLLVADPLREDRSLRQATAIIEVDGRRVLVSSVHLKCCGRIGSGEDEQRILEAGALVEAIQGLLADRRIDDVVIGGDLNLVGSTEPLDRLARGLPVNELPLAAAFALQLDGRSTVTWSDAGSEFVPGRLDYVLFSQGTAAVDRSFVFDSTDLNAPWRQRHVIQRSHSADASDHLPVVVDLELR